MGDVNHEDRVSVKLTVSQRCLRMFDRHVCRWQIDGGLVVAAIIVGAFLWAVAYLINKASF